MERLPHMIFVFLSRHLTLSFATEFYKSVAPENAIETEYMQAVPADEFSLEAYSAALQAPKLKGEVLTSLRTLSSPSLFLCNHR